MPWTLDVARIKRLIALGFPAASQVTLEVGVFAAATALAGKLDPVSSGSHQIALNIAALAFMVPLGLSSAGAVRVGHAVGARDASRAVLAGWGTEDPDPEAVLAERGERWLAGTPEEVIERLAALEDAGVTRVYLQHLVPADTAMVELVGDAVLPALSG